MYSVGGEVIDQPNGYGPVNARSLDKSLALKNADSYAYFAMVSQYQYLVHLHVSNDNIGGLLDSHLRKDLCRPEGRNRRRRSSLRWGVPVLKTANGQALISWWSEFVIVYYSRSCYY